jgi:hypothetical protein
MRWAGFVMHVGEMRNAYKILVRKLEWKHSEELNVGGRIILKWLRVELD